MTLADYLLSGGFLATVAGLWLSFGAGPALVVAGTLLMVTGWRLYVAP